MFNNAKLSVFNGNDTEENVPKKRPWTVEAGIVLETCIFYETIKPARASRGPAIPIL